MQPNTMSKAEKIIENCLRIEDRWSRVLGKA